MKIDNMREEHHERLIKNAEKMAEKQKQEEAEAKKNEPKKKYGFIAVSVGEGLDEIFKGTNSKDRHDGAKILIEQLVKSGGIGLVSTHDFELCDLENIHNWLVNFNFQEYYVDDKIKFDYKLRDGRSKTQNAKYLMKLAGIEIVEN